MLPWPDFGVLAVVRVVRSVIVFPSFFVVADIADDDDDDNDFDMEEYRIFHRYSFVRLLLLLIIGRRKAAFKGDNDDDDDDDEVREQIKADTGTDNVTDVDDKNDTSIIIMIAYTRT